VSKLAREYREDQQRAEKQRAIALREALKETDNELHRELESLHLKHPETIDQWYQLAKIAGISEERRFSGNLTPRQIINEVIGWARRVRIERQLAADVDSHIAARTQPASIVQQAPDFGEADSEPQRDTYLSIDFDDAYLCRTFDGEPQEIELSLNEFKLVHALWHAGSRGIKRRSLVESFLTDQSEDYLDKLKRTANKKLRKVGVEILSAKWGTWVLCEKSEHNSECNSESKSE
jgi:hypothetical protein